ncbi:MAG: ECF transporter S component [Clostridium sp.]|nr:ECF transporter S component [Clostridium sp.]
MNNNLKTLVRAAFFLAIAIVFQFIGRAYPGISQFFVGPAVNAVLLLTASICGVYLGVCVGVLTPLLAWALGQLSPMFGPFLPFIMIGNAIFVIAFYNFQKVKKYGMVLGIIVGAILKFLFLYISASKIAVSLKLFGDVKIIKNYPW